MTPLSIITIFCDDIREEMSGKKTIVGTYPDTVNVPDFPAIISKLAIYTRIKADVNQPIEEIELKISIPGIGEATITKMDRKFINKSRNDTIKNGFPVYSIINSATANGLMVPESGQVRVFAIIDGIEYLSGALKVVKKLKVDQERKGSKKSV